MTTREDLADWIDGQLRAEEAPARKLALARVNSVGGETHPMLQVLCSETDSAETLAGRIFDKAQVTARGLRSEGVTFILQSWNAEGAAREAFTFRIGPDGSSDELVAVSSGAELVSSSLPGSNPAAALGATIASVHGQVLRHQEVMFRMTMQGMAQSQKALTEQNRQLQEQNQTLLRKHQQLLLLVEKLHDRSGERELAIRSQELGERRKDDLLQMLTPVIPILISRLMSAAGLDAGAPGGGGGGADPMLAQLLQGLFATLDKEQLAQMIAPLRPEQAAVVFEVLKRFSGEQASRQSSIDRTVTEQVRRQSTTFAREESHA